MFSGTIDSAVMLWGDETMDGQEPAIEGEIVHIFIKQTGQMGYIKWFMGDMGEQAAFYWTFGDIVLFYVHTIISNLLCALGCWDT